MRKRERVPFLTAVAPAVDCTAEGSMTSGSTASNRLLFTSSHAISPAATKSATAATRPPFNRILIIVGGLEAKVESELEQRRRRERLELARRVVAARDGEIALWVAATVVRPELDVARGEHQAGVARPRRADPPLRDV